MSENNNLPSVESVATTTTTKKKPSKIVKYILNHKALFSLLFALIAVFIWAQCKINRLEKEKQWLLVACQTQMDSIQKADYLLVSKVFSWAVRSDMLRGNMEQANQYIEFIVKEPHVKKAFAINADNNTIILSTNKNEVGLPVADITLIRPTESTVLFTDSTVKFVTPIAGLNRKIGISVLETALKK